MKRKISAVLCAPLLAGGIGLAYAEPAAAVDYDAYHPVQAGGYVQKDEGWFYDRLEEAERGIWEDTDGRYRESTGFHDWAMPVPILGQLFRKIKVDPVPRTNLRIERINDAQGNTQGVRASYLRPFAFPAFCHWRFDLHFKSAGDGETYLVQRGPTSKGPNDDSCSRSGDWVISPRGAYATGQVCVHVFHEGIRQDGEECVSL